MFQELMPRTEGAVVVHLLDGLRVTVEGRQAEVPAGCGRLLAFVCLHGARVERSLAAAALWPDGDEKRAAGNLRSALWRLRRARLNIVECDHSSMWLSSHTILDVFVVCDWARRIIDGSAEIDEVVLSNALGETVELLPGWYEDWVVFERERVRQRLMHAFEALSRRLLGEGRPGAAIEAAMFVCAADPLRESAVSALLEAHLAEGNLGEAWCQYRAFADRLWRELHVHPTARLQSLASVAEGLRV